MTGVSKISWHDTEGCLDGFMETKAATDLFSYCLRYRKSDLGRSALIVRPLDGRQVKRFDRYIFVSVEAAKDWCERNEEAAGALFQELDAQ